MRASAAPTTSRRTATARPIGRTGVVPERAPAQLLRSEIRPGAALACALLIATAVQSAHAAPSPAAAAEARVVNEKCDVCHAVEGLSIYDPVKGRTLDLTVNPDVYSASLHGALDCEACHSTGYERMPHSGPIRHPRFLCVDCHDRRKDVPGLTLSLRREELLQGAHGKRAKEHFDCHLCHDPHTFNLVRERGRALTRIEESNHICLSCHAGEGQLRERFADLPNTMDRHGLFPNPRAHMRKLKCITCHTPKDSRTRHDVEAADQAVRECTQCHGSDSALLEGTYADLRGSSEAQPLGELDAAPNDGFRDNVYVIGSTNSPLLDMLSIVGFLGMLSLVGMHAVARLLTRRRRQGERERQTNGDH